MKSYYLTIDHWHLILQKSYPFSSNCRILMSRSECRRTKWSSSCPSKLSSSSQLPKIHHLLLLNRHQGVGLPEGSNFQSQYLWMCHPWRWTRRLVWVVSIYNLNHLNWKYFLKPNLIISKLHAACQFFYCRKCWYECDDELSADCPESCRSDCSCPAPDES